MADPRIVKGASAPLFDRLVDLTPGAVGERVFRHISVDELRASIGREIERIVSTKRTISIEKALVETDHTVLEYGVPDYSVVSTFDAYALQQFARVLEIAFTAFEPRMRQVKVRVARHPKSPTHLTVTVGGTMQVGDYAEDVWFPINISTKAASVQTS